MRLVDEIRIRWAAHPWMLAAAIAALFLVAGTSLVLLTSCQSIPAPVPPPFDDAPYVEPGPVDPVPPPEPEEESDAPEGVIGPTQYDQVATGHSEATVVGLLGAPELRQPAAGAPFGMRWPASNREGKLKTLEITFDADGRVVEGGKVLWGRSAR